MRRRGTITKWDDEKGFGFIAPNDRTDDVFLHRRGLPAGARRPKVGDVVHYELGFDTQRRRQAWKVTVGNPFGGMRMLWSVLVPSLALGAAGLAARARLIPMWVAILYLSASAVTVTAYALDKFRAQQGHWRISEGTLHLFELAGGWPGALAAQRILRHKTRKLSFQVVFWTIVFAHLAFWSWFAANGCGWIPR